LKIITLFIITKPHKIPSNSHQDIARKLLQSVGFQEPDDASIQAAIEVRDLFIAQLEAIRQEFN
jgi:hypothetical protein